MRCFCVLLFGALLTACATAPDASDPSRSVPPARDRPSTETKPQSGKAKAKQDQKAASREPEPAMVQLKLDSTGNGRPRTETRPMFNITVAKSVLTLNGTPVQDLEALRVVLSRYRGLVLTVAAHRCMESERAAEVLSLAQTYTTIPVTYGAFGEYGDDQCD